MLCHSGELSLRGRLNLRLLPAAVIALSVVGCCQVPGTANAPLPGQRPTISLPQDALARAKVNSPQFRAAVMQSGLAREDRVQARAALLPSVDYVTGAIYTQPNRESSPRFIAANGVRGTSARAPYARASGSLHSRTIVARTLRKRWRSRKLRLPRAAWSSRLYRVTTERSSGSAKQPTHSKRRTKHSGFWI